MSRATRVNSRMRSPASVAGNQGLRRRPAGPRFTVLSTAADVRGVRAGASRIACANAWRPGRHTPVGLEESRHTGSLAHGTAHSIDPAVYRSFPSLLTFLRQVSRISDDGSGLPDRSAQFEHIIKAEALILRAIPTQAERG